MATNAMAAMEHGLQLRQGKDGDVRIQRIMKHGPTDLEQDDTLLTINNKKVSTVQSAKDTFAACSGEDVVLEVSRGEGRVQEVFTVTIPAKQAPKAEAVPPAGPPEPKERRATPLAEVSAVPTPPAPAHKDSEQPTKQAEVAAVKIEDVTDEEKGAVKEKSQEKAEPPPVVVPELPPAPPEAEEEKELGNKAFKDGLWQEAIAHFTAAIEKCGEQGAPHTFFTNRSAAFLQNKEAEKALADAEQAIQLRSDFGKGWYRKGLALLHLGRADEAVQALKTGRAAEPTSVQIVGALARAEREAKGEGEKEKEKKKKADTEEEDTGLVRRVAERGMKKHAEKKGEKQSEVKQELNRAAESLASLWGDEEGGGEGGGGQKQQAEEAKAKGNALFAKGQFMRAAEMFTEAMHLDSSNHIYPANRSAALLKESKAEAALEDAELSAKLCPSYAKAYFRKGQALAFLGRLDLAIDALKKALDLEPDNQAVKGTLENFQRLRNGEDPEAILENPATMTPEGAEVEVEVPKQAREGDNVTLQINVPEYGPVKLQAKIPAGKKAGDKFKVKIGSLTELAETKRVEAIKAYKSGRMQKAMEDFTDAIHLLPSDPSLFVNRSAVYYALGRVEESLSDAEQSLGLQPSLAKGHYRRGVALAGLGRYPEAVSALERATTLDPADALAAEQLAQARDDVEKQRQKLPTSREAQEEDEEERAKRDKFVTKRAEAEVREQMHAQWLQAQTKKKALAGKALEQAEQISNARLSAELSSAKRADQHKQDTERAKFQAVAQRVEYDQFEQMVAGASLKPTKTKADSQLSGVILAAGSNASVPGLAPRLINPYADSQASAGERWLGGSKEREMEGVQRGLVAGEGAPSSCKEFLKWWKGLEKDVSGRFRMLRAIEPALLSKIFRTEMEAEVLGEVIDTLHSSMNAQRATTHATAAAPHTTSEEEANAAATHSLQFLNATTKLARFELNAKFLGKAEKRKVQEVVAWSVERSPSLQEEGDLALKSFGCAA